MDVADEFALLVKGEDVKLHLLGDDPDVIVFRGRCRGGFCAAALGVKRGEVVMHEAVGVFKLSERENLALFNATQKTAAEGTQRSLETRAA